MRIGERRILAAGPLMSRSAFTNAGGRRLRLSTRVGRIFLVLGGVLALAAGVFAVIVHSLYLGLLAGVSLIIANVVFFSTRSRPGG